MNFEDSASNMRMVAFVIFFVLFSVSVFIVVQNSYLGNGLKNIAEISDAFLQASFGVTSLSLTILAYAFSQIRLTRYPDQKRPFRFLANLIYFTVLITLLITSFLLTYRLTQIDSWFYFSLFFIYLLILILSITVEVWVIKELGWKL